MKIRWITTFFALFLVFSIPIAVLSSNEMTKNISSSISLSPEEQHLIWSYRVPTSNVLEVFISSDGAYIAAGDIDGSVHVFSRSSSTPLWDYSTGSIIRSVRISANGDYTAVGVDNRVYFFRRDNGTPLWDYQTSGEIQIFGPYSPNVSVSSGGNYIAAGGYGGLYFFHTDNNTPLWSYHSTPWLWGWPPYENLIAPAPFAVSMSLDSNYIAAINPKFVYLFGQSDNEPVWSYDWHPISVSISSDGNYIAAGGPGATGEVYLFGKENNTPLRSYQTGGDVNCLSISSNGDYIVAGSGGKVYLFSRSENTPLWSYQTGGQVDSVSISSDGNYISAGSYDGKVYLFGRENNTPLWSYQTGGEVYSVSISSDGNCIAAVNGWPDHKVYLFAGFRITKPPWALVIGIIVVATVIGITAAFYIRKMRLKRIKKRWRISWMVQTRVQTLNTAP